MNADKTDLKKEIRNCFAALPVSLSYPRKSAFICGEFVLVVGVGIEPTFRAFQTRANPSQLSDRRDCRLPIFDCRLASEKGHDFQSAIGIRQSAMPRPSAFARHAPF